MGAVWGEKGSGMVGVWGGVCGGWGWGGGGGRAAKPANSPTPQSAFSCNKARARKGVPEKPSTDAKALILVPRSRDEKGETLVCGELELRSSPVYSDPTTHGLPHVVCRRVHILRQAF